jgi:hypothetical protein
MKRCLLALLLGLAPIAATQAAVPLAAQLVPPTFVATEIEHLLEFVAASRCEFFRNGKWYDPERAQAHLRSKYQMLAARTRNLTTEDFIEKAASNSSFSGRPYQVRCVNKVVMPCGLWLHRELALYRISGAPPLWRGAP